MNRDTPSPLRLSLFGEKVEDIDPEAEARRDGIEPVIPGPSNRKKRIRHDKQAYKDRNVIERCYCRLKDFRRIATRYDKVARNYFSAPVPRCRRGILALVVRGFALDNMASVSAPG